MTYKDVERHISDLCSRYGLPANLFAGSHSKRFPQERIDINAQTDSCQKRLANAKYMVKYIEEDDRYIIWENRPNRLTFFLSRKSYLSALDCSTGFAVKGKGDIKRGNESFWVLSLEQLEQFISDIANQ